MHGVFEETTFPGSRIVAFECESCRQLMQENEDLRRELADLKASSVGKKLVWLPIAFWTGWIVMAFLPVLLVALFANFSGSNDNWIDYVFYGVQYSIPWKHWTIATCLIMLLAAPIWQRVILYLLTSSLLCFLSTGELVRCLGLFGTILNSPSTRPQLFRSLLLGQSSSAVSLDAGPFHTGHARTSTASLLGHLPGPHDVQRDVIGWLQLVSREPAT